MRVVILNISFLFPFLKTRIWSPPELVSQREIVGQISWNSSAHQMVSYLQLPSGPALIPFHFLFQSIHTPVGKGKKYMDLLYPAFSFLLFNLIEGNRTFKEFHPGCWRVRNSLLQRIFALLHFLLPFLSSDFNDLFLFSDFFFSLKQTICLISLSLGGFSESWPLRKCKIKAQVQAGPPAAMVTISHLSCLVGCSQGQCNVWNTPILWRAQQTAESPHPGAGLEKLLLVEALTLPLLWAFSPGVTRLGRSFLKDSAVTGAILCP